MFNMKKLPWVLMMLLALSGCDRAQENPAPPASSAAQTPTAPFGGRQPDGGNAQPLDQLLGPIALFPDGLLAQVLAASTAPEQVSAANAWLLQHRTLTGDALAQAANAQPWAPAVKSLTRFPDVLQQMAQNPGWTQALGAAYTRAPGEVMNAVQLLRQRAGNSGALKSNAQQQVIVSGAAPAQTIVIKPAQPNVVYVPSYGAAVYGNPPVAYYPGYTPPPAYGSGDRLATGLIGFTAGVMVGSLFDNSWGVRWGGSPAVVYNNRTFVGNVQIQRHDWRHTAYAPRAPFSEPHFAPARSNFTPRAAATPAFSPQRNAARYAGPTRTASKRPERRVAHALPPRERHLAPGPARLPSVRQPRFQTERDARPFAASHASFSTALNHAWGAGHALGGGYPRRRL
ncbi:DUF3300 domain-containing protein [Serratia sp. 1D1416]|uniref:DUF3300 domain-containing protein n=1 Tax=Serratia sp. 1D1416 TaxID=2447890 RepID=UPI001013C3F2|nr:DUF3300 domain-containing protein [Serratia sp. 1D1416]